MAQAPKNTTFKPCFNVVFSQISVEKAGNFVKIIIVLLKQKYSTFDQEALDEIRIL
jgi:hypothetical protein